jgi:hypothetical protein
MTILNLNGPTGRAPRGKKTVRAWMGVGLVIAVLGIGSTFAANIGITNNNKSEFGQGVSQTVYCGAGSENGRSDSEGSKITVTPISAFKNSSRENGRSAVPSVWTAPTFTGKTFVRVASSSSTYVARSAYVNDVTGSSSDINGYWISSRLSSSLPTSSSRTSSNNVFVPQEGSYGNYGFYKYSSWVDGSWSVGIEAVPERYTPSQFYLAGIALSDIPDNCEGRDFVISGYGTESSSPLNFIPSLENVDDITVEWTGSGTPIFSFDRTQLNTTGASGKVEVTQSSNGLTIRFISSTDRQFSNVLGNIVVETQDDLIGSNRGDD